MATLTPAQAEAISQAAADAARSFIVDKDNPGIFAPVLDPAFVAAGAIAQIVTGGKTTADTLRERAGQTVMCFLLIPKRRLDPNGLASMCVHESVHGWQFWQCGLTGKPEWKVFMPSQVNWLSSNDVEMYLEGMAYGWQLAFNVLVLGYARDDAGAFLGWMRDEMRGYLLVGSEAQKTARINDAVSIADAVATHALDNAEAILTGRIDTHPVLRAAIDAARRTGVLS